jgi:2'-5' RNA ligase
MKKTLRTFVAVELSGPVRARAEKLIAAIEGTAGQVNPERSEVTQTAASSPRSASSGTGKTIKWVEPHNLHITLKFLGDVHERQITEVCRAVAQGTAEVRGFELELRGAGAFPTAARPRTVWLGAGEGAEEMAVLHERIEAELAKLGFRKEHRRFQTHLTIGRVRGGGPGIADLGARLQQQADFPAGRMTVDKVTVFASTLTPAGPIYEVLGTARLGN